MSWKIVTSLIFILIFIFGLVVMVMSSKASKEIKVKSAIFAGGCFWCMEAPFEKIEGVREVISVYTGGHKEKPTYKEVSSGGTGHMEAIQVIYDPEKVTYAELLDVFWRQIDPTDANGQFVDRGEQYRSAIFYRTEQEKAIALKSKQDIEKSGIFKKPVITEILPVSRPYVAEGYHQDYYKKNPLRYKYYRHGSGRDKFLKKVWGNNKNIGVGPGNKKDSAKRRIKPSDNTELKQELTALQYEVTQRDGTEPPFDNEYWDNKKEGIYVDVVSGEPLFSSLHKYDSGTGWPSFYQPLTPENIVEREDNTLFTKRVEVRSKNGNSHIGHVFTDGPPPTGLRYCMNSAALRFIPKEKLDEEGYGKFLNLFK